MNTQHPTPAATPNLFPLFANLRERAVLVIGGGAVARRKVEALLEAGALPNVVAPSLDAGLRELLAQARIRHAGLHFDDAHLDGTWLVVAASDDAAQNRAVANAAHARGIFVNIVDDGERSSVHLPARLARGALQIAISTAGAAPVLARRLRERLDAELDSSLATLTALLGRERARIRWRFPQTARRRRFIEDLLDGDLPRNLRAGDDAAAQATFERALASAAPVRRQGHVALVGAGPGDPDLLTLKALRALHDADVILHDRLVGAGILELARRDAERISVGKRVGEDHDATQTRIHALMLQHARAGKYVVRLKGGDPTVFGRAGEEIDFLREHDVPVTIVPGITAAIASAAAAGISLTDRRHARSLTLLSPRGRTHVDAAALAAGGQTLAIYMGVDDLAGIALDLIRHGRAASTPCALVERASLPGQRVVSGSLAEIAALAHAANVRAPALLIIGEVAAQANAELRDERCSDAAPRPTTRVA